MVYTIKALKECFCLLRYLASYLSVRETVPQAYRLLGQIEEAVGNKQNAVEAYKRYTTFHFCLSSSEIQARKLAK